jgi:hypothetical protein
MPTIASCEVAALAVGIPRQTEPRVSTPGVRIRIILIRLLILLTTIQLAPSNTNNLHQQPGSILRPRSRRVRLPLPIQFQLRPYSRAPIEEIPTRRLGRARPHLQRRARARKMAAQLPNLPTTSLAFHSRICSKGLVQLSGPRRVWNARHCAEPRDCVR